MLHTKLVEKIKKHFIFNKFSPKFAPFMR